MGDGLASAWLNKEYHRKNMKEFGKYLVKSSFTSSLKF
jgi:hypothetical protein